MYKKFLFHLSTWKTQTCMKFQIVGVGDTYIVLNEYLTWSGFFLSKNDKVRSLKANTSTSSHAGSHWRWESKRISLPHFCKNLDLIRLIVLLLVDSEVQPSCGEIHALELRIYRVKNIENIYYISFFLVSSKTHFRFWSF